MAMSDSDRLAADLRILDHIEDAELAPLNWGLVDGGFDVDELDELIDQYAEIEGDRRSTVAIRESMVAHGLLIAIPVGSNDVWRTRMSEGVRLLVRMRQMFPQHVRGLSFESAPRLVSDYRFVARRRRFPRRDIQSSEYVAQALSRCAVDAELRRSLEALAGTTLSYSGFQARTAMTILEHSDDRASGATLVAAGTGSGKTKAFYIPALAKLATLKDASAWTKLLAVYPRTELLKDQLLKTLREIRALRAVTGVQLTIGAFYGDVPFDATSAPTDWVNRGGERVCPYLACPSCEQEMYWSQSGGDGPSLRCSRCGDAVGPAELVLTRRGLQERPPDVLLVTGEMLNRNLSSDYARKLFGLGVAGDRRPRFLLLDEVHTLTGSLGAHTGLVLRRWRHELGSPVQTIALSATLEDGEQFVAQLVGVPIDRVHLVQPLDDELVDGGNEYQIALRSDPASRAAVLSTTIQASMLLRRLLDLPGHPKSAGAYGTKSFVFTDDLDVTNRLLHFLRNAEGQTDAGAPDVKRSPGGSLANLRHPTAYTQVRAARDDGQVWDLPLALGHHLDVTQRIRIERTSSQDPGLEKSSDIVVATASLEVGLDDDSVGAVLQHKAPRDNASFIQRRGRAGRHQSMRPWTAVVLSDYGRDRHVFQEWDQLFAPVLRPVALPIGNRHILRMQAGFCLLDWLAEQLRRQGVTRGTLWTDATGPDRGSAARRAVMVTELDDLLDNPQRQFEFAAFVEQAMNCSVDEVNRLLWGSPRGVLSVMAPTLRRRLDSNWRSTRHPEQGDLRSATPLPDFLPSALFNDLLLPEVEIRLPSGARLVRERDAPPFMGVQQALREFAPGKVTHRFAVGHTTERVWIDPQSEVVDIGECSVVEPLTALHDENGDMIEVVRPVMMSPTSPAKDVGSSSNARPRWIRRFDHVGSHIDLQTPTEGSWRHLVPTVEAWLHEAGGHLVVHRATPGSDAFIKVGNEKRSIATHFRYMGEPVALGYRVDVDAIRITVADPGNWGAVLDADADRARSLRVAWFRHLIESDSDLRALGSVFLSGWLAEVAMALIVEQASEHGDLSYGTTELCGPTLKEHLDRIMTVVFQSIDIDESDAVDDDLRISTLHEELVELAVSTTGRRVLADAAAQLEHPHGVEFEEWLRDRYASTVAGAFVAMAADLDSEVQVDSLVVDVLPWVDGVSSIVISEPQPGGMGLVSRIVDEFQADPRRAWRLLEFAVSESEHEATQRALEAVVRAAVHDAVVSDGLHAVRGATRQVERRDAWERTVAMLEQSGIRMTQSIRTSIALRMVRAGTTALSDRALATLLAAWDDLEERLGIEIEVRSFAYVMSATPDLDAALSIGVAGAALNRSWRFSAILSLLWSRDRSLSSRHLDLWSPFSEMVAPERTLLAELLETRTSGIHVDVGDVPAVMGALAAVGEVDLVCAENADAMKDALLLKLVTPVEIGVLRLYPRLVAVSSSGSATVVRLELPEVSQ